MTLRGAIARGIMPIQSQEPEYRAFLKVFFANYLEIKTLLDMGCKVVANKIKGKIAQEIRETFGIVNDLTHYPRRRGTDSKKDYIDFK